MKTTFVTVLKNKEFTKLWGAQLISMVCASFLAFILMGRIYQATASTIAVGFFWAFYIFPTTTLGPFVGVILDWLEKKKILVYSSLVQALVVLAFLGVGEKIWPIYTIILAYSFCDEFFNPTVSVLIPSIVKKKELAAASTLYLFTLQGSIVFGFLLGGVMLKILKVSRLPFILVSVLLLLAAFLASLLNWKEEKSAARPEASFRSFGQELVKGYEFIKGEPKILFPMALLGGLQVILGMGLILLPSIAKVIFTIDFADSSFVIILPAVLGVILGGLLVERTIGHYLKRVLILRGLFAVGFSIFLTGVLLPLLKLPPLVLGFGMLFAFTAGVSFIFMFIPLQVLIQENTPFPVRGRVFGTLNTLVTIAAAIPVLAAATVVDLLGVNLVLVLGGMGLIGLGFYAAMGKYGILSTYNRP